MLQRLSVFLFFSRQLFCFVHFFFVVVVVVCSGGDVEPGPPGAVPQPKCFFVRFPRESFWAVYLFLYARTGTTREEKKRATP